MPTANKKTKAGRQALFVLGMHRSGTSAVGGLLSHLGASAPKTLMVPTPDNPRGYFESLEFLKVHDRILSSAGSRWNDWGRFNPEWIDSAIAIQLGDSLTELIDKEFGDAPLFLIKDPRICRFFPIWLEALNKKAITPKVIIPLRHPLEVARSLEVRDHFSRSRSLLLWLRHLLDAEFSSRELARTFIRFDDMLDDWQGQARKISVDLDVTWPKWSGDTEAKISDFLSSEMRHHASSDPAIPGDTKLTEWAEQAYSTLLLACAGPLDDEAKGILDRIRGEFDRTSGIFAAVVREHEIRVEGLYASVKSRLAEKTEESKELAKVREDVSTKLAVTEKALAEKQANAALLAGKNDELERKHSALAHANDQHVARLAVLEDKLQTAVAEHEQLRQSQRNELDSLVARLAEREAEHAADMLQKQFAEKAQQAAKSELAQATSAHHLERETLKVAAAALAERVAARDALLAERTAELAESRLQNQKQVEELGTLRESLSAAEAATAARFKETAKLTQMIFDLEQSVQQLAKQALDFRQLDQLHQAQAGENIRALALAEYKLAVAQASNQAQAHQLEGLRAQADEYQQASLRVQATLAWRLIAPLHPKITMPETIAVSHEDNSVRYQASLLRDSEMFDSRWYLSTYPDVGQSGLEPSEHYLLVGAAEGRNPSPAFDTVAYLVRYPDVRHSAMNPLVHYIEYGEAESRAVAPVLAPA